MSDKISIRFYNKRPVRAVWDDYAKTRNYRSLKNFLNIVMFFEAGTS